MPCPHFDISIASRATGANAVASAAYQSGERLYDEHDHETKSYSEKRGIEYTEIMLPENAPEEFEDRNTLWNSVEDVEKQYNAQLARKIVAALPREIPREDQIALVQSFCQENFVDHGMCADIAIHDNLDGNPHVHIMLTMRPLDENGKWLPKSRKVYELDEDGNKIKLPSGNYMCHKENTTDWNEQSNAEVWRHSWEVKTNSFLEKNRIDERLDMRSYERQGIDKKPQFHMGPAVTQMERRGIHTFIGDLNREIRKMNEQLNKVLNAIRNARAWVKTQMIRYDRAEADEKKERMSRMPITPKDYLMRYMDERSQERLEWKGTAKLKGTVNDFEGVRHTADLLAAYGINNFSDYDKVMSKLKEKVLPYREVFRENQSRLKVLGDVTKAAKTIQKMKPIHDEYRKIHFKKAREKYWTAHKKELSQYLRAEKVVREFVKSSPYNALYLNKVKEEAAELCEVNERIQPKLDEMNKTITELREFEKYVDWVDSKITEKKREEEEIAKKAEMAARRREEPVSLQERIDARQRQEQEADMPQRSHKKHSYDMER